MLKKLIVLMFVCSMANAATWYISPTGNDTTGNGSTGSPWLTLQKGMAEMSGGDTLIVKDGTYTGTANQITVNQKPPTGSAEAWTIIKAENDGAAIFDGEDTRCMYDQQNVSYTSCYWQIEGLVWARSSGCSVLMTNTGYVKLLRCGAYDTGDGNEINFAIQRGCRYVLVENCYAWGGGRYKYSVYQSSFSVIRSCVARHDRHDAWSGSHGEPIGGYSLYSTYNCEVQNCILIDSDQSAHYENYTSLAGSFLIPSTDMDADTNYFRNCIGLNSRVGGLQTNGNNELDSINGNFINCVMWDYGAFGSAPNLMRGQGDSFINCTFGVCRSTAQYFFNSYDTDSGDTDSVIKNSIIYDHSGNEGVAYHGMFSDVEFYDYNSYWLNTSTPTLAAHDIDTVNPLTNSLFYITRIESGSDLDGQGESGVNIGATAMTLIGTSGTLYGETGYATDTEVSMWPFPNEDLIKTKMAAYEYEGVVSTRGFCSPENQLNGTDEITLTSYIWEYLGNQMPSDIYGDDTSSPTISGITATVHATSATVTWTTNESANSRVDYGTTTGYGSNVTGASYSTSHSLEITGLTAETVYHYKITTADSTGNSTESADQNFTTDAEEEEPEEPATVGITIQGVTITGGISIIAD